MLVSFFLCKKKNKLKKKIDIVIERIIFIFIFVYLSKRALCLYFSSIEHKFAINKEEKSDKLLICFIHKLIATRFSIIFFILNFQINSRYYLCIYYISLKESTKIVVFNYTLKLYMPFFSGCIRN